MRVAVVGAGISGVSTALALAERGHEVTLYEQFSLNHAQGSSHGHSRIIRKAYPDAFYTAIMDEAYGLWHELQKFSDRQIVFEPGLLYFGSFESENLRDVIHGLQELSVQHELLDHEQVRHLFPDLSLKPGEIGIYTPEAGWVHAEMAVQVSRDRLVRAGGLFVEGQKANPERIAADFDRYVLATGAWITQYAELPVRITLQTFAYVETYPIAGPVWIDDCEEMFYGFPSEPGKRSIKIGVHQPGRTIDPSAPGRNPTPDHMRAIRHEARERFEIEASAFEFQGCLYTRTADEDFLWGRHGENGFFVSACSGHGFKFGPWIGRKMADFVEDEDAPENHPRFCWPETKLEA